MIVIEPSYEILTPISESKINELQHKNIEKEDIIKRSPLSVKFIVSCEMIPEFIASFTQISICDCDYNFSDDRFNYGMTFIRPVSFDKDDEESKKNGKNNYQLWEDVMITAEAYYSVLLRAGVNQQEARSVLPNSTKTEITITANYCEWHNFFKLRTVSVTHPQMRKVTIPLLKELKEKLPIIFDDIEDDIEVEE